MQQISKRDEMHQLVVVPNSCNGINIRTSPSTTLAATHHMRREGRRRVGYRREKAKQRPRDSVPCVIAEDRSTV